MNDDFARIGVIDALVHQTIDQLWRVPAAWLEGWLLRAYRAAGAPVGADPAAIAAWVSAHPALIPDSPRLELVGVGRVLRAWWIQDGAVYEEDQTILGLLPETWSFRVVPRAGADTPPGGTTQIAAGRDERS